MYINETSKNHLKLVTCEVKNHVVNVVVDILKEIKTLYVNKNPKIFKYF